MNQGFANIIAEGMRSGNEANRQAFQDLGEGVSSAVEGTRQGLHNMGYKKLLDERANIIGNIDPEKRREIENRKNAIPIIGNIDPQKLQEIENRIRNHEMIGYTRGLKTALTPQDYERRDVMNWQAMQAQEAANLKAQQDLEERELKVLDSFKETDLLQFDAIKEFEANKNLIPETREQLINAMAREEGIKNDEARQRLLGELSSDAADKLRNEVEQISKSAGTEFNQALKKVTGGSFSDLPKLLAAIPAVMAQGWAGRDTDTSIRIKNAIDKAFDDSLDYALVEKAYRRYTPEQMKVGKKKSRNRDYASSIGKAEDFNE